MIEEGGAIRKILKEKAYVDDSTSKAGNNNEKSRNSGNLEVIETLEQRVRELEKILNDKETCLASMNLQLALAVKRDHLKESNS